MVVGFAMGMYCLPRSIAVVAATVVTNITASPTLLPHEVSAAHEGNKHHSGVEKKECHSSTAQTWHFLPIIH